ncbi:hypothetical protein [Oceanobacter mangrovi]|uniref:hypothetical protein n=1 Tax=Oceanobacter mangrovi TaxID=2862510 RepID=UPI0031BBACB3
MATQSTTKEIYPAEPPEPAAPELQAVQEPLAAPGAGIYLLLLLLGTVLLALLPWQASWIDTSKGWYIQPMIGSSLGLVIMTLFAALRVGQAARRVLADRAQSDRAGQTSMRPDNLINQLACVVLGYRTAIICGLLFLLYIESLSVVGFTLSTLLFITTLLLLSRLLNRFWLLMAVLATAMMVLVFRVGVSVWMPDVWLYGLLPDQLADFANMYL